MLKKLIQIYKKDKILLILTSILLFISTTLFTSLNITSHSLKQNYDDFSYAYNKNDFIIIPNYEQVDELMNSVTFYEFEKYQEVYINTSFALDYDNIKNLQYKQYLTNDDVNFFKDYITDEFIESIKASSKPSYIIFYPIKQLIYSQLDPELSDYYKDRIATTQAKYYTKILFLMTLNETNYLNFLEFTLDNRILEKNDNNQYLKGTYARKFDLTISKKIVKSINGYIDEKEVHYFISTIQDTFNRPYVVNSLDGKKSLNLQDKEVAIYQEFALRNNLKLGYKILINNDYYTLKAFIYTPDTIYPILSNNQFYYKLDQDTLLIMNENDFQNIENNDYYSISYNAKFNQNVNKGKELVNLQKQFKTDNILLIPSYSFSDQMIQINISNLNILSYTLSASILIISILFMSILLIRKINQEQKQIGILKALGYHKHEIMTPYILQFLIITILASFLGVMVGGLLSQFLLKYLYTIFLIPFKKLHINLFITIGILSPIIMTTLTTYIIMLIKLNKKSVSLLNQSDTFNQKQKKYSLHLKVIYISVILTILMTTITYLLTKRIEIPLLLGLLILVQIYFAFINHRHKHQFTKMISLKINNRNFKKILSFNITIFFTSTLLLFVFFGKNVYKDIYLTTKNNFTYSKYYKYPNFINLTEKDLTDCENISCEGIASYRFEILKVNDKNINERYFVGGYKENYQSMIKFLKNDKLIDKNIIVSKPLAEKYNIKINDKLKILTNIESNQTENVAKCTQNEKELCLIDTVKVVDIANNLTNMSFYGNIKLINYWYFGDTLHDYHINTIYSNSQQAFPKESILSQNILITYNMQDVLGQLFHFFYTIDLITFISFVLISFVSIIIVLLIMELTIKESISQIALLKAFGYGDKEIRSILLSQYNPNLILMFFLAIPFSYLASNQLFRKIGFNMNISLPVNIRYSDLIFSLLIIVVVYIISSYLALVRIKFIPLSCHLKK